MVCRKGLRMCALGLVAALAMAGCDGNSSGNTLIDCAWLEGDNCWKESLAAALACLPPDTEQGEYDVGHNSCTYPDGTLVTFDDPDWDVVVSRDGQVCLAFVELTPGYVLETPAGVLEVEATDPADPVIFHCPDGSTATALDYNAMMSCPMDTLPSTTTSSGYLDLNGGPGNTSVVVYDCVDP